jgi:methyl-accepting chemotaxis protein
VKIQHKFVAACVVFAAVPAAVGMLTVDWLSSRMVDQRAGRLAFIAGEVGEGLDRVMSERYADASAFAASPAAHTRAGWYKRSEKENPVVQVMNGFVESYGVYTLMVMVDTQGRVVAVNSRDAQGKELATESLYEVSLADAPWFQALQRGETTGAQAHSAEENRGSGKALVDGPAPDRLVERTLGRTETTLGFSAKVVEDGKVIGYWTNRFDLDVLGKTVSEAKRATPFPMNVMVVGPDGRPVITAASDEHRPDDARRAEWVAQAKQGKSASGRDEVQGVDTLYGYAHADGSGGFGGLGWSVVIDAPTEAAAGEARTARVTGLGLLALVLVLVTAAAWLIGRVATRPLVELARVAEEVAAGGTQAEASYRGDDELGALADAFRSVSAYIQQTGKALSDLSLGQTQLDIKPRSDKDELTQSLLAAAGSMGYLVKEAFDVAGSARAGRTTARLQLGPLAGDYRGVAVTINHALDAMAAPAAEATSVLESVARCDLTAHMAAQYEGEHDRLKQAVNTAVGNLRDALSQVARGADQVKAASGQIASGSQALAAGASEQAASLTETRATLDSVASMTSRNAENAQHANALSTNAQSASARGAESMEQMTQAVGRIRAAVENTAQIIRDINQIAFQTNLLALNAAVEAARAGDAGRGFAVVADEVRNLAQQAKEAAHRTEELLQESIRQAERGETITQEVTTSLNEIVGSVKKVGQIITEIAVASREQSESIQQVHRASTEMDRVTHQNAASSEELSSTAEELAAQAQDLTGMVSRFRLASGDAEVHREVTPAPRARGAVVHAATVAQAPKTIRPGQRPPEPPPSSRVSPAAAQLIPFEDELALREF